MIDEIKQRMREIFAESSNDTVDEWWDSLDEDQRKTVLRSLALTSKDNIDFKDLAASTKSEIQAYFEKHKGRIK